MSNWRIKEIFSPKYNKTLYIPHLMHDPQPLYCPAREMAYRLDPEDPQDRRLLDAFNAEKSRG